MAILIFCWTLMLRQVHVGFLLFFWLPPYDFLIFCRFACSVLLLFPRHFFPVCLSDKFSVQFRHTPTFLVATVVKCPLCPFQSPKLSDTGCVHSGEPHLWKRFQYTILCQYLMSVILVKHLALIVLGWVYLTHTCIPCCWFLFGFQLLRIAACMGGCSTQSFYTSCHTQLSKENISTIPWSLIGWLDYLALY
jgi:hypothetical protein